MDQYNAHREKFQMQIDAALLRAAQDVARSLVATDTEVAPIALGAADAPVSLFVSRKKEHIIPMHTFELDGATFYVGFPPQSVE